MTVITEIMETKSEAMAAPCIVASETPQCVHALEGYDVILTMQLSASAGAPTAVCWTRGDQELLGERYAVSENNNTVQLSVQRVTAEDAGQYTLLAKNAAGEARGSVQLQVDALSDTGGTDAPVFVRRLCDLAVKVGTRTRFLVEVRSSSDVKVTWHRSDRPVVEGERCKFIHEGNFFCVDVAPVTVDDGGRWTCLAENSSGRSTCSSHLNVLVPKAYKTPEFLEELRAILTEGGTVSLECKVIGVPTPVLRWYKDGKEIKAGDVFALTANAEDPTSLGTYTCEAVNCMGKTYSSSRVHVVGKGSREGSLKPADSLTPAGPPPIFTQELCDKKAKIGEPLTLSCHVGVPPWPKSIAWYNKDGRVDESDKYHVMEDGLGGYMIETLSAETADEGEWKCVATNSDGSMGFSKAIVTMAYPKNYRKPRFLESLKAILTEEGLVSFECKVVGFPTPQLRWFKDGQELKPGDVYQLTGTNSLGSYSCIAKNLMGEATSSAELTVEDIQSQLSEEERLQLFSTNQPPKFFHGLKSCEAKINEHFRLTVQVSISPEPKISWYRDDEQLEDSEKYQATRENLGVCHMDVKRLEIIDQAEWKCVATNDFGHSVTSCFMKLIIPKHFKKPRFLECLRAILSEEGAVNLECKVIGVPQPVLKWYKDGEELKPGDIHRIISGEDGRCCLGTYTCEASNCMGVVSSSASLLGFEERMLAKPPEHVSLEQSAAGMGGGHMLARNTSLSTIHEERTSQMYDPATEKSLTIDERAEVSFSFDGKEVSVSLYETPDLTEEEALQVLEMYADELSEHVSEHNVVELPPMRFTKESSNTGNLLMEAVVIDVTPEFFASAADDDLRTDADIEDLSISEAAQHPGLPHDADDDGIFDDLDDEFLDKALESSTPFHDAPRRPPRKKSSSRGDSEAISDNSFHSVSAGGSKGKTPSEHFTDANAQSPDYDSRAKTFESARGSSGEQMVVDTAEAAVKRKTQDDEDLSEGKKKKISEPKSDHGTQTGAPKRVMRSVESGQGESFENIALARSLADTAALKMDLTMRQDSEKIVEETIQAGQETGVSEVIQSVDLLVVEGIAPDPELTPKITRKKMKTSDSNEENVESDGPPVVLRRKKKAAASGDGEVVIDTIKCEKSGDAPFFLQSLEDVRRSGDKDDSYSEEGDGLKTRLALQQEEDQREEQRLQRRSSSMEINKAEVNLQTTIQSEIENITKTMTDREKRLSGLDYELPRLQSPELLDPISYPDPTSAEKAEPTLLDNLTQSLLSIQKGLASVEEKVISELDPKFAQSSLSVLESLSQPISDIQKGLALAEEKSSSEELTPGKAGMSILQTLSQPIKEFQRGLASIEKQAFESSAADTQLESTQYSILENVARPVEEFNRNVELIQQLAMLETTMGDESLADVSNIPSTTTPAQEIRRALAKIGMTQPDDLDDSMAETPSLRSYGTPPQENQGWEHIYENVAPSHGKSEDASLAEVPSIGGYVSPVGELQMALANISQGLMPRRGSTPSIRSYSTPPQEIHRPLVQIGDKMIYESVPLIQMTNVPILQVVVHPVQDLQRTLAALEQQADEEARGDEPIYMRASVSILEAFSQPIEELRRGIVMIEQQALGKAGDENIGALIIESINQPMEELERSIAVIEQQNILESNYDDVTEMSKFTILKQLAAPIQNLVQGLAKVQKEYILEGTENLESKIPMLENIEQSIKEVQRGIASVSQVNIHQGKPLEANEAKGIELLTSLNQPLTDLQRGIVQIERNIVLEKDAASTETRPSSYERLNVPLHQLQTGLTQIEQFVVEISSEMAKSTTSVEVLAEPLHELKKNIAMIQQQATFSSEEINIAMLANLTQPLKVLQDGIISLVSHNVESTMHKSSVQVVQSMTQSVDDLKQEMARIEYRAISSPPQASQKATLSLLGTLSEPLQELHRGLIQAEQVLCETPEEELKEIDLSSWETLTKPLHELKEGLSQIERVVFEDVTPLSRAGATSLEILSPMIHELQKGIVSIQQHAVVSSETQRAGISLMDSIATPLLELQRSLSTIIEEPQLEMEIQEEDVHVDNTTILKTMTASVQQLRQEISQIDDNATGGTSTQKQLTILKALSEPLFELHSGLSCYEQQILVSSKVLSPENENLKALESVSQPLQELTRQLIRVETSGVHAGFEEEVKEMSIENLEMLIPPIQEIHKGIEIFNQQADSESAGQLSELSITRTLARPLEELSKTLASIESVIVTEKEMRIMVKNPIEYITHTIKQASTPTKIYDIVQENPQFGILENLAHPLEKLSISWSLIEENSSATDDEQKNKISLLALASPIDDVQRSISLVRERILFNFGEDSELMRVLESIAQPIDLLQASVSHIQETIPAEALETLVTEKSVSEEVMDFGTALIQELQKAIAITESRTAQIYQKVSEIASLNLVESLNEPLKKLQDKMNLVEKENLLAVGIEQLSDEKVTILQHLIEPIEKIQQGIALIDERRTVQGEKATLFKAEILESLSQPIKELQHGLQLIEEQVQQEAAEGAVPEASGFSILQILAQPIVEIKRNIAQIEQQVLLEAREEELSEKSRLSALQTLAKTVTEPLRSLPQVEQPDILEARGKDVSEKSGISQLQTLAKSMHELQRDIAQVEQQVALEGREEDMSEKSNISLLKTLAQPMQELQRGLAQVEQQVALEGREEDMSEKSNISLLKTLAQPMQELQRGLAQVEQQVALEGREEDMSEKSNISLLKTLAQPMQELQRGLAQVEQQVALEGREEDMSEKSNISLLKTLAQPMQELQRGLAQVEQQVALEGREEDMSEKSNISLLKTLAQPMQELQRGLAQVEQQVALEGREEDMSEKSNISLLKTLAQPMQELQRGLAQVEQQVALEGREEDMSEKSSVSILQTLAQPMQEVQRGLAQVEQQVALDAREEEIADKTSTSVFGVRADSGEASLREVATKEQQVILDANVEEISEKTDVEGLKTMGHEEAKSLQEAAFVQELLVLEPNAQEMSRGSSISDLKTWALPVQEVLKQLAEIQQQFAVEFSTAMSDQEDPSGLKALAQPILDLHQALEQIGEQIVMEGDTELSHRENMSYLATLAKPIQEIQSGIALITEQHLMEAGAESMTDKLDFNLLKTLAEPLKELERQIVLIEEQELMEGVESAVMSVNDDTIVSDLPTLASNASMNVVQVEEQFVFEPEARSLSDFTDASEQQPKAALLSPREVAVVQQAEIFEALATAIPDFSKETQDIARPVQEVLKQLAVVQQQFAVEFSTAMSDREDISGLKTLAKPIQDVHQALVQIGEQIVLEGDAELSQREYLPHLAALAKPIQEIQSGIALITEQHLMETGAESMSEKVDIDLLKTLAAPLKELERQIVLIEEQELLEGMESAVISVNDDTIVSDLPTLASNASMNVVQVEEQFVFEPEARSLSDFTDASEQHLLSSAKESQRQVAVIEQADVFECQPTSAIKIDKGSLEIAEDGKQEASTFEAEVAQTKVLEVSGRNASVGSKEEPMTNESVESERLKREKAESENNSKQMEIAEEARRKAIELEKEELAKKDLEAELNRQKQEKEKKERKEAEDVERKKKDLDEKARKKKEREVAERLREEEDERIRLQDEEASRIELEMAERIRMQDEEAERLRLEEQEREKELELERLRLEDEELHRIEMEEERKREEAEFDRLEQEARLKLEKVQAEMLELEREEAERKKLEEEAEVEKQIKQEKEERCARKKAQEEEKEIENQKQKALEEDHMRVQQEKEEKEKLETEKKQKELILKEEEENTKIEEQKKLRRIEEEQINKKREQDELEQKEEALKKRLKEQEEEELQQKEAQLRKEREQEELKVKEEQIKMRKQEDEKEMEIKRKEKVQEELKIKEQEEIEKQRELEEEMRRKENEEVELKIKEEEVKKKRTEEELKLKEEENKRKEREIEDLKIKEAEEEKKRKEEELKLKKEEMRRKEKEAEELKIRKEEEKRKQKEEEELKFKEEEMRRKEKEQEELKIKAAEEEKKRKEVELKLKEEEMRRKEKEVEELEIKKEEEKKKKKEEEELKLKEEEMRRKEKEQEELKIKEAKEEKERKEELKLKEDEMRRKEKEAEELKIKKEEEKKKKKEEELKLKEEEMRRKEKEQEELKIKEEEEKKKKKEEELKLKEDEMRRKEKEAEELKIKKEEEKKKKKEEELKLKEEEMRRKEKEQEELKIKEEEEKKKKKEEELKLKEDEMRRKEKEAEELKIKKEEEKKKKKEEELKLKEEEMRRKEKEQEELKIKEEEEKKKKKEEELKLKEEEMRRKEKEQEELNIKEEEEKKKKKEEELKLKEEEMRRKEKEQEELKIKEAKEEKKRKEEELKLKEEETRRKEKEAEELKIRKEEEIKKQKEEADLKLKKEELRKKKQEQEELKIREEEEVKKLKEEADLKHKQEEMRKEKENEESKRNEEEQLKKENERKEDEQLKLKEEERKIKEKEREELKRKEDEQKKKEKEQEQIKEENRMKEEEQKKKLKLKKEEQKKKLIEQELKQKEEEKRKKEQEKEELKRKEEEQQNKLIEEEAVKQKQDEQIKKQKEQESKQKEEEQRKKEQEEKDLKLQEEEQNKKKKEEERKQKEEEKKIKEQEQEKLLLKEKENKKKQKEDNDLKLKPEEEKQKKKEQELQQQEEEQRKKEQEQKDMKLKEEETKKKQREEEELKLKQEEQKKKQKEEEELKRKEEEKSKKEKEQNELKLKEELETKKANEKKELKLKEKEEKKKQKEQEEIKIKEENLRKQKEQEEQAQKEKTEALNKEKAASVSLTDQKKTSPKDRKTKSMTSKEEPTAKTDTSSSSPVEPVKAEAPTQRRRRISTEISEETSTELSEPRRRRRLSSDANTASVSDISSASQDTTTAKDTSDQDAARRRRTIDDDDSSTSTLVVEESAASRRRRQRDTQVEALETNRLRKTKSFDHRPWADASLESSDTYTESTLTPRIRPRSRADDSSRNSSEDFSIDSSVSRRSRATESTEAGHRDAQKKPTFCTRLTDRTAAVGSRIKLMCSVLGSPEPKVEWLRDGLPLQIRQGDSSKYRQRLEDGLAHLEVLNASTCDSGEFTCVARNVHGESSTTATLKVFSGFEPAPFPPTFTRGIKDVYHFSDDELVLECRVRSQPPPRVTWLKDNVPLRPSSRYQQTELADGVCRLTINGPDGATDSGQYTCRAENAVWTDQISHTVQFEGRDTHMATRRMERSGNARVARDGRRPHFSSVLTDHLVPSGGTIALQVEIRGGARPDVTWLRGSEPLGPTSSRVRTFEESGVYTLMVADARDTEAGIYTCRAVNAFGHVDTSAAVEVVRPGSVRGGRPAMFMSRPDQDMTVTLGEDISVSFRVQGDPKPRVIWMKGTRDITNSQRSLKETIDDYVRLTLKRALPSDAGTYCIMAKNVYGCDRSFVTVQIRQRARSLTPSISHYPQDTSSILRDVRDDMDRAKLRDVPAAVGGEPVVVESGKNWLTLAWPKGETRGGIPVLAYKVEAWLLGQDGGARWQEMGISPINSFDAFNLKAGNEYQFRITPRNRYGWGESVTTRSPITVGRTVELPEFVQILPGQLKALSGSNIRLECQVRGDPTPEVHWYRDGTHLDPSNPRYSSDFNGSQCRLSIEALTDEDSGRYMCEATNKKGRVSTFARLLVVSDPKIWIADNNLKRGIAEDEQGSTSDFPPQFTMRLRDRRVQMTYPVRLTCQVVGRPAPQITWCKDGQEITQDDQHSFSNEEHFHTLELSHTSLEHSGCYSVTARNNHGAVSCKCHLVVDKGIRAYVAPDFLSELESEVTIREGGELRLSAQVEAYPTVGVMWHRDGVRLRPSRRAIMTLDHDGGVELAVAGATPRDAGVYSCTATNEVGRAETSVKVRVVATSARASVKPPQVLGPEIPYSAAPLWVTKPRSTDAVEGDTVIIQCEVVGDPKPDVWWLRDFLKPDYYRDAPHFRRLGDGPQYRLEIPRAKLDFTGAYSVIARNIHGEAKAVISLQIYAKGQGKESMEHSSVKHGAVQTLPQVRRELKDLRCCDGDAVTLECCVEATPTPDVRWEKEGRLVPLGGDFQADFDGDTARLSIHQVYPEDEGEYTCVVYNELGKASTSACLVVDVPEEKETLLSQHLTRPPGLLSTTSTPMSTPRNTPRTTPSRSKSPSMSRQRERDTTPSSYAVVRTRRLKVTSPKFYAVPHNRVAEEGETIRFQCAIAGHPTPWVTWDKDGLLVTPNARLTITEKDDLRVLELTEVTVEDAGLYRITLENEVGRIEASARLEVIGHTGSRARGSVRAWSASPRTSPTFGRRLIGSAARAGNRLTLEAEIRGTPSPVPAWYRNGELVVMSSRVTPTWDGRVARLEVDPVDADDAGVYCCLAENEVGVTQCTARVLVLDEHDPSQEDRLPPVFLQELQENIVVAEGTVVELQAQLHGSEPIEVVWSRDNVEVPDCADFRYVRHDDGRVALRLADMFPEDAGVYRCEAFNRHGDAVTCGRVSIADEESGVETLLQPPQFAKKPAPVLVSVGKQASFCARLASKQGVAFSWTVAGRRADSDPRYQVENDGDVSILHISDVDAADAGVVTCTATSSTSSSSVSTELTVMKDGDEQFGRSSDHVMRSRSLSPARGDRTASRGRRRETEEPEMPATLLTGPTDTTVLRGDRVILKATFAGCPTPQVRWLRAGRELVSDGRLHILTDNTESRLTLDRITADEGGKYVVSVENTFGADCHFASVAVEGPPDPPASPPTASPTDAASCVVAWSSAPYDGGCIVTGYSLEMRREAEEAGWSLVSDQCHSFSHTVRGLTPGEGYVFRVRALNVHGASEPSVESKLIKMSPPDQEEELFSPAFAPRIVEVESGSDFKQRFEILEELGKGRFGVVHKVSDRQTNQKLAAKFIRCIKSKDREKVQEEIDIMNCLRHPKLLQLAAAFENPREIVMVMELISGGELFERVVADDFTLTERDCILFMRQIVEGVEYMHKNAVVHLDLKPENIMCYTRTSHQIKLIDFGLAKKLDPAKPVRVLFGTPEFIPPEIINYENIGLESDMWSVGVICYVLLSGLSPFMGDSDADTFANITRADFDFDDEAFDAISQESKDFISSLLIEKKEKRLTASDCLQHKWLAQHDECMSNVALCTDKLKKFIIRRKWQKTGNAIRALGRMATLSAASRRNSAASTTSSSPRPSLCGFSRMSSLNEEDIGLALTSNNRVFPPTNESNKNSSALLPMQDSYKENGFHSAGIVECALSKSNRARMCSERSDSGISDCSSASNPVVHSNFSNAPLLNKKFSISEGEEYNISEESKGVEVEEINGNARTKTSPFVHTAKSNYSKTDSLKQQSSVDSGYGDGLAKRVAQLHVSLSDQKKATATATPTSTSASLTKPTLASSRKKVGQSNDQSANYQKAMAFWKP